MHNFVWKMIVNEFSYVTLNDFMLLRIGILEEDYRI